MREEGLSKAYVLGRIALLAGIVLLSVSCQSPLGESRETVDAVLVRKTPIADNDKRLNPSQALSTWLFPCVYRLVGESAGGQTNKHIVVLHEGIERWRVSQRYADRTVGDRYRLTIGRIRDYPQFDAMPRHDPQTDADLKDALEYDCFFDLNEASFSLQKLRADYRMWKDLRRDNRSTPHR